MYNMLITNLLYTYFIGYVYHKTLLKLAKNSTFSRVFHFVHWIFLSTLVLLIETKMYIRNTFIRIKM